MLLLDHGIRLLLLQAILARYFSRTAAPSATSRLGQIMGFLCSCTTSSFPGHLKTKYKNGGYVPDQRGLGLSTPPSTGGPTVRGASVRRLQRSRVLMIGLKLPMHARFPRSLACRLDLEGDWLRAFPQVAAALASILAAKVHIPSNILEDRRRVRVAHHVCSDIG